MYSAVTARPLLLVGVVAGARLLVVDPTTNELAVRDTNPRQYAAPMAVFHTPGEGERLDAGTTEMVIKATSDDTGGSFFLSENTIPPQFPGPPPHVHEAMHDMFYVLQGTMTFLVGDETRTAGPGTFVCAPPGVVHTFSNQTDDPVRFLNLSTPGGWEHYMRELAEAGQAGTLTPETIGQIASRHDFKLAPAPDRD